MISKKEGDGGEGEREERTKREKGGDPTRTEQDDKDDDPLATHPPHTIALTTHDPSLEDGEDRPYLTWRKGVNPALNIFPLPRAPLPLLPPLHTDHKVLPKWTYLPLGKGRKGTGGDMVEQKLLMLLGADMVVKAADGGGGAMEADVVESCIGGAIDILDTMIWDEKMLFPAHKDIILGKGIILEGVIIKGAV